jgi:hypothetical protein
VAGGAVAGDAARREAGERERVEERADHPLAAGVIGGERLDLDPRLHQRPQLGHPALHGGACVLEALIHGTDDTPPIC